ncbi:MAG: hypothetical protein ACKV2U_21300 [Bryobacteraceae bacterium]
MKQLTTLFLHAALLALPALCVAAENVFLTTAEDGSTIARNAAGEVLWQRFNTDSADVAHALMPRSAAPSSAAMPSWDPLTTLDSTPPSYLRGPVFDSLGNAWVVINNSVNLVAIQSSSASGTWKAPHIIGPALPNATYTVGVAVDQAGGFYVTYGTGQPGASSHPLMWTKYTPAGGWKAPALIYDSPYDFNETFPVIDSTGRVVVVFNGNGISSIASNPAQSSWGNVQTIAPRWRSPILPSVAGNKSGTRLALVYLQSQRGLRYCFFNSTTGQWDPEIPVPDSEKASFTSYSVENAFPLAVDEAGNVTVVCMMTRALRYTIGGFRYEAGQWTVKELLPLSRSSPEIATFGNIALNPNGTVLVAVPNYDGQTGVNISVFRYTPGQGWNTETAANYDAGGDSRCKVAWFQSTEAVVVYKDYSVNPPLLRAALHSNGAWGSGPAIPGNFPDASPFLAGAPSGEALLGMAIEGIYVTWLRP